MKLTTLHPEQGSLAEIQTNIDQGVTIYRSPHVGNVNSSELGLLLALDQMGADTQVELVDTVRGDDRYSNPRVATIGERTITLASRNTAKSRVVGGCEVEQDAIVQLQDLGIDVDCTTTPTLRSIHLGSLVQALPESIRVTASSRYFAAIGEQAYGLALASSVAQVGRSLRTIDTEGKIREVVGAPDLSDIYGLGNNRCTGLLPPLEGMMAIEMIKAVIDGNGSDVRIVHVAGPDMIRYTKQPEIMVPAERIATMVLGELGIGENVDIEYVLPCMKTTLESSGFEPIIVPGIMSQYDLIQQSAGVGNI